MEEGGRHGPPTPASGGREQTDLVQRAQRGGQEAVGLLALPLGDRLFAVAAQILRDTDLAADAAQQALVNVWREIPGQSGPGGDQRI